MTQKKEIEYLKEYNVVLKNYIKVLKKKLDISKDTILRNQKYINVLEERVKRYESKYRNNN